MAGRKPKPASLHLIHGTTSETVQTVPQNKKKQPLPACPAWVPPAGKQEWKRVSKILGDLNILTLADRSLMIQYCVMFAQLHDDPLAFSPSGHAQFRMAQSELGLTPASRAKIAAPTDDGDKEADPWAKL